MKKIREVWDDTRGVRGDRVIYDHVTLQTFMTVSKIKIRKKSSRGL